LVVKDLSFRAAALPVSEKPKLDLSALSFDTCLVLFDSKHHRILAYNESAAIVWRALARGAQSSDAAAVLSEAYGISNAQTLADTDAIIQNWMELGLLEGSHAAASGAE
jgi:hypothetical protein